MTHAIAPHKGLTRCSRCQPDCPDYPGGCPPGLATPPHCTFEDDCPDDEHMSQD